MRELPFIKDDGGRAMAGFRGADVGDCVCRAIVIATGRPYREVYDRLALGNANQRRSKRERASKARTGVRTAQNGIFTSRAWFKAYMRELGFEWTPCLQVGDPTRVYLCQEHIPVTGRLVVAVRKHYTAVIGGTLHDTWHVGKERDPAEIASADAFKRSQFPAIRGYWRLTR